MCDYVVLSRRPIQFDRRVAAYQERIACLIDAARTSSFAQNLLRNILCLYGVITIFLQPVSRSLNLLYPSAASDSFMR